MVNYRRQHVSGGMYFFTVTLKNRQSGLLVDKAGLLGEVMRAVQAKKPWETLAIVIMPDHLHALWKMPAGDDDYSSRWRAIKSGFVRSLAKTGHVVDRNQRGEADIWQRRFWEHAIRDEDDLYRHIDYIHFNPVRHGQVSRVIDWPCSSFHRYVMQGVLPSDWAGTTEQFSGGFGE